MLQKINLKVDMMKKQTKQKRMTPSQFNKIVIDVVDRMQKERNESFNFYDDENLSKYFADYVRLVKKNNLLSTKQCTDILNDDLKRSLTSNILKNKDRSINQSYAIFQNVIASAEIAIKEKYGADNFYDLEFSKNKQAQKEFKALNNFAISRENQFEQLSGKSAEDMIKITNVNELAAQSVLCLGVFTVFFGTSVGILGTLGGLCDSCHYKSDYAKMLGIVVLSASAVGSWVDSIHYGNKMNEYYNKLNTMLQEYEFKNVDELRQYATKTVYSYLTPEEVKQLNNELLLQKLDVIADKNGFGSAEEMLDNLKNNSSTKTISSSDRLELLASEKNVTNLNFAKENGFTSYNDVLTYLNNHKILVGKTEKKSFGYAGWSEYNYDNASAKILAQKLSNLDEIYDAKKQAILNGGTYSKTLVYENQDLANEVLSCENIINSANAQIAEGGIYSPDEKMFFASNDVLSSWGFEKPWGSFLVSEQPEKGKLLKDGLNYEEIVQAIKGEGKPSISDKIEDVATDTSQFGEQVSEFAIGTGTLAGMAVGIGVGMTAKTAPQIISAIKNKKAQKTNEKLKKIDEQFEP